jgi:hypothetical protein
VNVNCDQTADVAVELSSDIQTVPRNGKVRYAVKARNSGPNDATNFQALVKPGRDTWFVYDTLDSRCKRLGVSDEVVCTLPSIASGQEVELSLEAQVSASADCNADAVAETTGRATPLDREDRDNNHGETAVRCE